MICSKRYANNSSHLLSYSLLYKTDRDGVPQDALQSESKIKTIEKYELITDLKYWHEYMERQNLQALHFAQIRSDVCYQPFSASAVRLHTNMGELQCCDGQTISFGELKMIETIYVFDQRELLDSQNVAERHFTSLKSFSHWHVLYYGFWDI